MHFTGFADEAADSLENQIRATKELGWEYIESRNIDGTQIHDLPDEAFDRAAAQLQASQIKINCFGSAIANWAKRIDEPFESSLAETARAIPRMQRMGTKLVRIMSFAVLEDREPDDQMEQERFRRLRELQKMFADAGITPLHENCMNYGGMAWKYTIKLLENVPGLKLVFDTGNPIFSFDRSRPRPWPKQSSWEFYSHVKEHVEYIHIKDCRWNEEKSGPDFTFPGQGDGDVYRILKDLFSRGYDGGISIEPHMTMVAHDESVSVTDQARFENYIQYGRNLESMVQNIKAEIEE